MPYLSTSLADWVDSHSEWHVRPEQFLQSCSYTDDLVVFDNKGMLPADHRRMLRRSMAVDGEVRRRYALRKMQENGLPSFLALSISYVLYHPLIFRCLRSFAKTNAGARARKHVVHLFGLEGDGQRKTMEITFPNGRQWLAA